ncbi:MAG: TonB-dependent receptor [Syntrophobacterales bacterium]|nr:TonB-dependent receptor [Syntrophobacterales bacterium]
MKRFKFVLCLLILIFTFASVAQAKEAVELEKTVVTATRTEKAVKDAPASVTIITKEEIEATSARYVDDLLRDIVGVDVKRPRGISSSCTHIRLRGFSHPRGTLLLRDGIPINRIACGGGKLNEIPVEFVGRIEVVRGINSSLYGTSAMGGVINIITKKPEKELKGTVEGSYGTFNTWNSGVTLSGTAKEKLGYQLYYNHLETDGYNPWSDSFIATKPAWVQKKFREAIVDQDRNADNVFAKLTYEIDSSSTLGFAYSYWDDDISNGRKYNYNEFERNRTSLTYEKQGKLNISANLYYLDEDFEFTYDRKPSAGNAFDTIEMISKIPVDDIGGMMSISFPIKKAHLLTVGTDHRLGKMENKCDWQISARKTRTEGKQYRGAFFVQDEIDTGRFLTTLSARVDWYKIYDGSFYDSTGPSEKYSDKSGEEFNPKFGLVYHLTDSTTLRGSVGRASNIPYLYSLYGTWECPPGKFNEGNPDLDLEYTIGYEAGIEQRFGNQVMLRMTGFYNDINDWMARIYNKTQAGVKYYRWENVDKVETSGIELEAEYRPVASLKLYANYGYLDTKIREYKDGPQLEGNRLIDQPRHRFNAGFTYTNPDLFTINLRQRYVSDRYDDMENTQKLDEYATFDVKISRDITKFIKASLEVEDIFNKTWQESYQWETPGRMIFGRVKVMF